MSSMDKAKLQKDVLFIISKIFLIEILQDINQKIWIAHSDNVF